MSQSPLINKPLPTADYKLQWIEISPSDPASESCKLPTTKSWADLVGSTDKTIVITGAPAAFSPTCSISHIPAYVANLGKLVAKGVDKVIVLTVDNPFANQAWAKSLGVKDTEHIKFASDPAAKFIKHLGMEWEVDQGVFWSGRWTIIVKGGKVTYVGKETKPGSDVTVSSVDAVFQNI